MNYGGGNMPLIACPQCGEKVSDSADVCVHCGFNLLEDNKKFKQMYTCKVDGLDVDFSVIYKKYGFDFEDDSFDWDGYMESLKSVFPDEHDCDKFHKLVSKNEFPKSFSRSKPSVVIQTVQSSVPKCPVCQSTSIQKVDAIDRAISIGILGIASGKIGKTRKCKSCGYLW